MKGTINFLDFPQDVQFYTLEYLHMGDLLQLRITNTKCKDLFQRAMCHVLEAEASMLESIEGRGLLKNRQVSVFHKENLLHFSNLCILENVLREINNFFQKNSERNSNDNFIEETTINFILEKYKAFPILQQKGDELQFFPKELKMDREIVLTAVSHSGSALVYADDSLKADREIVLTAVKENGSALRMANDVFKKDPEIAMLAIKENFWTFDCIDSSLKQDKNFILRAINTSMFIYSFLEAALQNDPEVHKAYIYAKKMRSIPNSAFSDQPLLRI